MTESAAFALGIVGNLLARHIDPARQSLAETISERLSRGGIPPNHDLEKACRQALRQALQFLAQTLDLHIAVPRNLKEAFANRRDAEGKWKPLLEWWHTEQREWFKAFLKAVESEDALAKLKLPAITRASDLNQAIRSLDHAEWTQQFTRELLRWTERHTPFDQRPSCFDTWAGDGWPVSQDDADAKITLYQAWCLFLQDHFKTDEKVRAILTADWLASIDARLATLPLTGAELSSAIAEPLKERLAVLPDLLDAVEQISAGVAGLQDQSGMLLGLMLEYGKDMCSFREAVLGQGAVTRSKLDASLTNDEKIMSMLRQLLEERASPPVQQTASTAKTVVKRIADSELLNADGASRYERLVGRSREKASLTRAWRHEGTNVLIYVAWGGVGKTSLVTDWIVELQAGGWPGVDAFFDWSFYSQGTKDQSTATSDKFFDTALRHFGETAFADSPALPEDKAKRLAQVIRSQRSLLVLDGIEPLQHPRKKGQEEGRLKDGGLETLLRELSKPGFSGLCIVTTRVPVIDLRRYNESTVRECELNHLSVRHGAELLHLAGARFAGQQEIPADDEALRTAAIEVKGHAMTLQMLGGYLATAHGGDIQRRDRVDLAKVFEDQLEGHTYNVMAAYEGWFQTEGDRGLRQLAVLRMMGLFDRAADADCLSALRDDGGITGISDAVAHLTEAEWRQTLHLLSKHRLAHSDREAQMVDVHPLIREYFGQQLRQQQPEAFRQAHSRLFDQLCASTEHRPDTLAGLQPLYQAVTHGCLAGRQQEAVEEVYRDRILRGMGHDGFYSTKKLGAIGADLGAVAAFFDEPWTRLSPHLSAPAQAWLLNQAAVRLRALGRLTEAVEPMRAGLEMRIKQELWLNAARFASNLSELEVTLGRLGEAVAVGRRAIEFADRIGDAFLKLMCRTTTADALHQAGERAEAWDLFAEAECMQAEDQPEFPLLYSMGGFRYAYLLLACAERAAWQKCGSGVPPAVPPKGGLPPELAAETAAPLSACAEAERRATQTLEWAIASNLSLLSIALDHLTQARAALYRALLTPDPQFDSHHSSFQMVTALAKLRAANTLDMLPKALLTAAFYHGTLGGDPAEAERLLDEAQQIAERGPMPLYLADVHLHRARLAGMSKDEWRMTNGEAVDPKAELAKARALIEKHHYGRRREELEDAEAAAVNW